MVGKSGSKPPPNVSSSFKAAASGKSRPRTNSTASSTNDKAAALMKPVPGGMAGGPTPPIGAKSAADRQQFAAQLSAARKDEAKAGKSTSVSESISIKASKVTTQKAFNSAASKGKLRADFKSAARPSGKSGRSR